MRHEETELRFDMSLPLTALSAFVAQGRGKPQEELGHVLVLATLISKLSDAPLE